MVNKSLQRKMFENFAHLIIAPWLSVRLRRMNKPPQILFILSHARSGSTLLQHVLCSHPKVLGFGENKVSYTVENDLTKLIARTALMLRSFGLEERFFVDKLVWDYKVSGELLQSDRCRFLFLLRAPQPTLASMVRKRDVWLSVENAGVYFATRLAYLADTAETIHAPHRTFFLSYEQLITHTTATLAALQAFLALDEPLTEEYELLPTTGRWGFGDRSANISAGRIVAPTAVPAHTLSVPDAAQQAHARCATALQAHCTTPASL